MKQEECTENGSSRKRRVYRFRLTDNPNVWLTVIGTCRDVAEATRSLQNRFGRHRVIDVVAYDKQEVVV